MNHNFRKLSIWNRSMSLVEQVYQLNRSLPSEEKFGLISQMSRCSISIPSNIAEGSGRDTNKDFNHFLSYAIASSFELETQLLLVNRIHNIDCNDILNELTEIQKMMLKFKNNLKN